MKKNRVIVWRITQTCNMNCQFCSYSNEVKRQRSDADPEEVSRIIEILGEYQRIEKAPYQTTNNFGKDILISWIGGEPFLWKPLLPLSQQLFEKYQIKVSTTTNGILLSSKEIRSKVLSYFSEIVISLDGFAECNDLVRNSPGHLTL